MVPHVWLPKLKFGSQIHVWLPSRGVDTSLETVHLQNCRALFLSDESLQPAISKDDTAAKRSRRISILKLTAPSIMAAEPPASKVKRAAATPAGAAWCWSDVRSVQ